MSAPLVVFALVALVVAGVALLRFAFTVDPSRIPGGVPSSWPTTEGVTSSVRVVHSESRGVADTPLILFVGQYGVNYRVSEKEHWIWMDTGFFDPNEDWTWRKVRSLRLGDKYTVRYNPSNPSEAYVVSE